MKSILSSIVVMILLLTASCKKDHDGTNSSTHGLGAILINTWTIGHTTYKATTVQATGANLIASQVNGSVTNTLTVSFNGAKLPVTEGKFKIVAASPGSGQVAITTTSSNGANYAATGNDNVYANVYLQNNKITVTTPLFWAKSNSSTTDSIQINGGIAQH